MRKEKGFATLEIILLMVIISTLAGIVLPKMGRIVDTATLDYEVKKFRSEFFFARSLSRSASYEPLIFSNSSLPRGDAITFKTDEKNYRIECNGNLIREKNFLPQGFKISVPSGLDVLTFTQGKTGKTGTYTFISPLNKERSLVLNSVGRLRIDNGD